MTTTHPMECIVLIMKERNLNMLNYCLISYFLGMVSFLLILIFLGGGSNDKD